MAKKPQMACKHCAWWSDRNQPLGECHRSAPIMRKPPDAGISAIWFDNGLWPTTNPNDFCGEYKYRGTPSDR